MYSKFIKLFAVICLLVLVGCEDFTDVRVEDQVVLSDFNTTDDEVVKTLTTAYSSFGDEEQYSLFYYLQRELLTDHVKTFEVTEGFQNHAAFQFPTTSAFLEAMWWSPYRGIFRCNTVISAEPEEIKNPDLLARARDEARFLRAMYYFHLLKMWRDVPLRTPENMEDFAVPKVSRSGIYEFIEADLNAVIQSDILPISYPGGENQEVGRATIGAAKALLGKVLLYQDKFTESAAMLKQVIDLNFYTLVDNPEYIWHIDNQNNAIGNENIYEVQFDNTVGGDNALFSDGQVQNEGHLRFLWIEASQFYNLIPTDEIMDLYAEEPGDKRRPAFIRLPSEKIVWDGDTLENEASGLAIKKGLTEGPPPLGTLKGNSENHPVLRLADVYLMYSEAIVRGGGDISQAITYINEVRARAFDADYANVDITSIMSNPSSSEELFELLKKERAKEMAFEAQRFNDLRRWGDLADAMPDRFISGREFYPIPQSEIDKSGGLLIQDPNY